VREIKYDSAARLRRRKRMGRWKVIAR